MVIRKLSKSTDKCPIHLLVDSTKSVQSAMNIISKQVFNEGNLVTRVPPLAIARLGRGGKTTVLYLLFH